MKIKEPLYKLQDIEIFTEPVLSSKEFDITYFDNLFSIEEKNFWFKGRRELIYRVIRKFIPGYRHKKMLEVGCGGGNILSFLQSKGIKVEGADVFFDALMLAKKRLNTNFYQMDIKDIPFRDEFDIVGLFDVIEHIHDEDKVLSNIRRSLKPNGYFLLTIPAFPSLWSYFDEISRHKRRYKRMDIINRLNRQGFSVIKATYFFMLLLPVFILRRKVGLRKLSDKHSDEVKKEFSLNPVLNFLFLQLIRFETLLILFCSLPVGSSLLVLARKSENTPDNIY